MKIRIFCLAMVFFCSGGLTGTLAQEKPAGQVQDGVIASSNILDHPNFSRRISLDLRDINIQDALHYLAGKADINIAVSKNIDGKVTLSFQNVKIKDALEIILLSNDLAAEMRGDFVYVMLAGDYENLHGAKWAEARSIKTYKPHYIRPVDALSLLNSIKSKVGNIVADNESGTVVFMDTPERTAEMEKALLLMDQEPETRVFELKYADAKEIETNLTGRLDAKGVGMVKADARSNRVVVTALPGKMAEIARIIKELDAKTRQVLIEAKIVKVSLTPRFDMGIDWEYIVREGRKRSIDLAMKAPVSSAVTSYGKISAGTMAADNFNATLKLIQTVGETKLLSSPRITAVNNKEAKILVGTREAYITKSITQGQTTITTAESVTFLDVGVQLYVTPVINEDGFVIMKIRPEVSSVARTLTTSDGNEIPIVDTTSAETTIMVKDGYTIVIGGLIKDEKTKTVRKVPVLGDVPWLKYFFSQVSENKEKTELVVFLTPHVLSGDEGPEEMEAKSMKGFKDYEEQAAQ